MIMGLILSLIAGTAWGLYASEKNHGWPTLIIGSIVIGLACGSLSSFLGLP